MLTIIPDVLPHEEALALGRRLADADWIDGNATSGPGAALAKRNRQLAEDSAAAADVRAVVTRALGANATFLSAALPNAVFPPLFNAYGVGEGFAPHVDNAIRVHPTTGRAVRTDLSATLFLSDPGDYDGGELTIDGPFGTIGYRLPAGQMLLYPATSLHRVTPVTRGERIASFFWIESLVSDHELRAQLYALDRTVQALAAAHGLDDPQVLALTGVYHNLVRRFAVT